MATIQESIEIKQPVDAVFKYATDIKNWPQWETNCLEAEQTSKGPVGIGTTFKGVNKVMGRLMPWTSTVKAYEPNKLWGEVIFSGKTMIEVRIVFEPLDRATKVTMKYEMAVEGLLRFFAPMVTSSMRKQTAENLANLKKLLEAERKE